MQGNSFSTSLPISLLPNCVNKANNKNKAPMSNEIPCNKSTSEHGKPKSDLNNKISKPIIYADENPVFKAVLQEIRKIREVKNNKSHIKNTDSIPRVNVTTLDEKLEDFIPLKNTISSEPNIKVTLDTCEVPDKRPIPQWIDCETFDGTFDLDKSCIDLLTNIQFKFIDIFKFKFEQCLYHAISNKSH